MDLGGPLPLAQADGEHLEQPALVPPGERRVRLDPVEQDDAVGLEGVAVEMDRQAERVGAQHDGLHLGSDRAADRGLGDAQLGQAAPLPGRGAAAVAPHRGDDEGVEPERAHGRDGRADDPADPAMPRLPAVIATRPPGARRVARRLREWLPRSPRRTSATAGCW